MSLLHQTDLATLGHASIFVGPSYFCHVDRRNVPVIGASAVLPERILFTLSFLTGLSAFSG